jgi:chemotaxis protein MotA
MDISTIIGLFFGCVLIITAITMGGTASIFFNVPGLLIVVGGSLAALFVKFPLHAVFNAVKVTMNAFFIKVSIPEQLIHEFVDLASIARKNGILALEKQPVSDPFIRKAIEYCVDGYADDFILENLTNEILILQERHETGQRIFRSLGEASPAFGMIGTLIGLVQMLARMDDPKNIGPAMAVALLTTFYGALLAHLVFIPIADKLELRSQHELLCRQLIVDGVLAVQRGLSPKMIQDSLQAYLPPKDRFKAGTKAA